MIIPMIAGMGDIPLLGLSAPVILGLAVLMILTGRIIPRRTYDDLTKDRDEWKAAHQLSERQRMEQARQIDLLLEYGRTVDSIMRALPHPLYDLPRVPTRVDLTPHELENPPDPGEEKT